MKQLESIESLLRKAGLKRTSGRIALIDLLRNARYPLTQEEISERLAEHGLNRVSIYRALASFLETGLVHRVESGDRIWKFAFCGCGGRGHCHPHFICRACGKVECLEELDLPEVPGIGADYRLEEREFYLRGLCPDCSGQ